MMDLNLRASFVRVCVASCSSCGTVCLRSCKASAKTKRLNCSGFIQKYFLLLLTIKAADVDRIKINGRLSIVYPRIPRLKDSWWMFPSVWLSEPSASAASAEERLNQEAEELEKRLSLLSHNTGARLSRFSHVKYGILGSWVVQQKSFAYF